MPIALTVDIQKPDRHAMEAEIVGSYATVISINKGEAFGMSARGVLVFFLSSRSRHTRFDGDWISAVCSSDLGEFRVREPAVFCGFPELRDVPRKVLFQLAARKSFFLPALLRRSFARRGFQLFFGCFQNQIGRASCRERV